MGKSTKELLGNSLEQLLEEKPLNKITVGEIASRSGVSRMTFYYHFKDMYELVKWVFVQRAAEARQEVNAGASWQDGLAMLFDLLAENKNLITNVYYSVGHVQLHSTISEILSTWVDEDFVRVTSGMNISETNKAFVSRFFVNAVIGMCYAWIQDGMRETEVERLVNNCHVALQCSVVNTLHALES